MGNDKKKKKKKVHTSEMQVRSLRPKMSPQNITKTKNTNNFNNSRFQKSRQHIGNTKKPLFIDKNSLLKLIISSSEDTHFFLVQ